MKKMIILLGCVCCMILSCSKEEPTSDVAKPRQNIYEWQDSTLSGDAEMGMKMLFNVGDSISVVRKETTRATTTIEGISTFDENDIVTIALTSNKQASGTKNYKVKSNKTSLTNAGSSDGFAWKSQTEVVTLTAWSYGGGVDDADTPQPDPDGQEFTLEADQQAYGYKELLYSHERSVSYLAGTSGGGITLPMYHQLARVVITLSRKATDDAATVSSVTIGNGASSIPIKARFAKPTAEQIAADVHTGTWTVTERSETAAIRAKVETANTVYSAVLIPDNYASGIGLIRVTMSDGNVYTYTTDSNVSIEAGMQYNYSVSIGNDVATLEAVYPTEWTASGYPISSYNSGETFGVYVYNGSTPVYSNIPMTAKTTGTTVELDAGSYRPHLSTSYTYYIYYPYRANPGTVSTDANNAADFFADVISGWTIDTSQGSTGALRNNDLQISMISPTASNNRKNQTVTATMAHKMGLARFTLITNTSVPTTITYLNNIETSKTGSNTVTASSSFSGFTPYNNSGTYLYLVRPNTSTVLNSNSGIDQWLTSLTYNITSGGVDTKSIKSRRWAFTSSATWNYSFVSPGSVQTLQVPCTGNYKLEVWGGEVKTRGYRPQVYGGYATGTIKNLPYSTELFVCVGQRGKGTFDPSDPGYAAYNGGGYCQYTGAAGAGATHIAWNQNLGVLKNYESAKDDILIVAGGGGGADGIESGNISDAPHGGGENGVTGISAAAYISGGGGSQTGGGVGRKAYEPNGGVSGGNGTFGQGGAAGITSGGDYGSSGGGGWYGGGGTQYAGAGGGGSGHLHTSLSSASFTVGQDRAGSADGDDGYARISIAL